MEPDEETPKAPLPTDLRELVKRKILTEVIDSVAAKKDWRVLLVDKESVRIISAACRMYDVMEEGVALVENLEKKRQQFPKMDAIYLIGNSEESIEALLADWKDPKKRMYNKAHVFFLSHIHDDDIERIKASPLSNHLKVLAELNLQFLALEEKVFHFDSPHSFRRLFGPDARQVVSEQSSIAEKLVSVCVTLNQVPIVRFAAEDPGKKVRVAANVAEEFQRRMDEAVRNKLVQVPKENQATLLILDRSHDLIAPLLHEFTFQAMAYDLLEVQEKTWSDSAPAVADSEEDTREPQPAEGEPDCYIYNDHFVYQADLGKKKVRKEVLLGDHDEVWKELRHQPIPDVSTWIRNKFAEMRNANPEAAGLEKGDLKGKSLAELRKALKAFPVYESMKHKMTVHFHLADACLVRFKAANLAQLAKLEQNMANGEDKNAAELPGIFQDHDVEMDNKLRLFMIYIVSQEGIKEANRKRLMKLLETNQDPPLQRERRDALVNLFALGVTLDQGKRAGAKKLWKKKSKSKAIKDEPSYDLLSFVPQLKLVGDSLCTDALPEAQFPYTKKPSNVKEKAGAGVGKKTKAFQKKDNKKWWDKKTAAKPEEVLSGAPPLIIFVAGGMTHSEMRTAYELSVKYRRPVYIGSDYILTPHRMLDELGQLKKVGAVEASEESS